MIRTAIVLAALTFALAATTAFGQSTYSFDENGGGLDPTGKPLPSTIAVSPLGGGPATLAYTLPFIVAPGDVLISEPPNQTPFSDILRFVPSASAGTSQVFVYSDNLEGDPVTAPADVGIPTAITPSAGPFLEVGAEGSNGFMWTPPAGAPGSVAGAVVTYNFVSDGVVPEPDALLLASLGGVALLLVRRQSRLCSL
jgi:hypothetical protein